MYIPFYELEPGHTVLVGVDRRRAVYTGTDGHRTVGQLIFGNGEVQLLNLQTERTADGDMVMQVLADGHPDELSLTPELRRAIQLQRD